MAMAPPRGDARGEIRVRSGEARNFSAKPPQRSNATSLQMSGSSIEHSSKSGLSFLLLLFFDFFFSPFRAFVLEVEPTVERREEVVLGERLEGGDSVDFDDEVFLEG
jgi:hypothetical protein